MKSLEQKHCSNCGDRFGCGPANGQDHCWCEDLPRVSLVADEDQDCLCPTCLQDAIEKLLVVKNSADNVIPANGPEMRSPAVLVEGEDYYSEGLAIVFTARYHRRRGYCCENRCRHCPYGLGAPNG